MVKRVFLGWEKSLCDSVSDWLLKRQEDLPDLCVVVPTSQSARRLKSRLAEKAGTILTPDFTTPSQWLRKAAPHAAPDWLEVAGWHETLANLRKWEEYRALFPRPLDQNDSQWFPLAKELHGLAARLQENGHTFSTAAHVMKGSRDAERWQCLAKLEWALGNRLSSWNTVSRANALAQTDESCLGDQEYVLAGIADAPPWLMSRLRMVGRPVTSLIGAPQEMEHLFDDTGLPSDGWLSELMPWPETGSVHLTSDNTTQISKALEVLDKVKSPSDQVVMGAGDAELAVALTEQLSANGWIAFDPAPDSHPTGVRRWLLIWQRWLQEPTLAALHDLLSLPESELIADPSHRFGALKSLGAWRDDRMIRSLHDLRRIPVSDRNERKPQLDNLLRIAELAESRRTSFLAEPFPGALGKLLDRMPSSDPSIAALRDWIEEIGPWFTRINQPASFWFDLLQSTLPLPGSIPPEDRIIDVLGWLELPYETGNHLVVCGMNEGKIPAVIPHDSWLGEDACHRLGLPSNSSRAARDSFLSRHLFESHRNGGRVDWICGKSGSDGTSLLPSRILLQSHGKDLAGRVKSLFRDLPASTTRIRRESDWQWQVPEKPERKKISVTAFRDWLLCPFRYFIKYHHRLQESEPERIEWNHRDFGNLFHKVVELWAKDPEAKDLNKVDALQEWLSKCLDRTVAGYYGTSSTLAMRIQTEALRTRLGWFAREQAVLHAGGWRVRDVEKEFVLNFDGMEVKGMIDRVDFHEKHGWRVIDYKTSSKPTPVIKAHIARITKSTRIPDHWGKPSPVFFDEMQKGKSVSCRWTNLQLPLYAAHLREEHGVLPEPCYINVGSAQNQVTVDPWLGFSDRHLDAAYACAEWIIDRIKQENFWPPADQIPFQNDIVTGLSCGWQAEEMFRSLESPAS